MEETLADTEMMFFDMVDTENDRPVMGVSFPSGQSAVRLEVVEEEHLVVTDEKKGGVPTSPAVVPGVEVRNMHTVDAASASEMEQNGTIRGQGLTGLRVCWESDRTRVDIEGWLMGWGVQFHPSGQCALHWYRDAYPEEDRLDHPHISLYGSMDDVRQGTGGDVEKIAFFGPRVSE